MVGARRSGDLGSKAHGTSGSKAHGASGSKARGASGSKARAELRSKAGGDLRSKARVRRRRPLKRHVQLDLLAKPKRRRRPGSRPVGRPPKGARAGSPHKARPTLSARHPVHVVLRVVAELGRLRKRGVWKAMRWATLCAAKREDFRIIHASLQNNHIHLLVEANNQVALSRGMQGFQISAAKLINAAVSVKRAVRRRGQVFADRFHEEIITTPRQARNALSYVLNNWRKHREDRDGIARSWLVDPFSSGAGFSGWKELAGRDVMWRLPETYEGLIVWFPRTWLLSEGWRRHGLIGCTEVPSAATKVRVAATALR